MLHDISQAQKDVHTFSLACRISKVDLTEAENRSGYQRLGKGSKKKREWTIHDGPA